MERKKGDIRTSLIIIIILILASAMGSLIYFLLQNIKGQWQINNDNNVNVYKQANQIENTYLLSDYIDIVPYEFNLEGHKVDEVFEKYELKKVKFKNLPVETVDNFIEKQTSELGGIVSGAETFYNKYKGKVIASTEIFAEINGSILSIREHNHMRFLIDGNTYNYLNIDLTTKRIVSTSELIKKYGYSKEKLITKIVDGLDKYSEFTGKREMTEIDKQNVDTKTGYFTKEYFLSQKPSFQAYVNDHIDEFNIYLKNSELYYDDFSKGLLAKLGYTYPSDGGMLAEEIKLEK